MTALTVKARLCLKGLAAVGGECRATELPRHRAVLTLAEHGYIELTARLTDKGRAVVADARRCKQEE